MITPRGLSGLESIFLDSPQNPWQSWGGTLPHTGLHDCTVAPFIFLSVLFLINRNEKKKWKPEHFPRIF